jgi:hypothetical protein
VKKGGTAMKKGKLIGKIFGIVLVFVLIGVMLGGTMGATGVALADGVSSVSIHVPYFSQCDGRWGNESYAYMEATKYYPYDGYTALGTICNWGCALTCMAMVLNYYGVSASGTLAYNSYFPDDTNPRDLNKWLKEHGGYSSDHGLLWKIDMDGGYSNSKDRGVRQIYHETYNGADAAEVDKIETAINSGNPVIVSVKAAGISHFVVITGIAGDTYYINDPGYPKRTTLAPYNNKIYSVRIWDGSPARLVMPSGLYAGSSDPGLVYYYIGGNE